MKVTVGWVLRSKNNPLLYWGRGRLPNYATKDRAERFPTKHAAGGALDRIGDEWASTLRPVRLFRRVRP